MQKCKITVLKREFYRDLAGVRLVIFRLEGYVDDEEPIFNERVVFMTETEKLDLGLEYNFRDEGVNARKLHAIEGCAKLNAISPLDEEARETAVRELFGSTGSNPTVLPVFSCDNGRNIFVGEDFLPIIM